MPRNEISGATVIVTGASRGFGRGIATALTKAGARVTGVARDGERTARVFRDMAVAAAHRNLQLRDLFYGDIGRAALGEPNRIPGR